jgi:hypothetical protein
VPIEFIPKVICTTKATSEIYKLNTIIISIRTMMSFVIICFLNYEYFELDGLSFCFKTCPFILGYAFLIGYGIIRGIGEISEGLGASLTLNSLLGGSLNPACQSVSLS